MILQFHHMMNNPYTEYTLMVLNMLPVCTLEQIYNMFWYHHIRYYNFVFHMHNRSHLLMDYNSYKYSEPFPNNPYTKRPPHMYMMMKMLLLLNKMCYLHKPYKYNKFQMLRRSYIS